MSFVQTKAALGVYAFGFFYQLFEFLGRKGRESPLKTHSYAPSDPPTNWPAPPLHSRPPCSKHNVHMAISLKRNELLSRLKPLLSSQRFSHSLVKGKDEDSKIQPGIFKMSNWNTMDSRSLGIYNSMISLPSILVLKILQGQGYEAYLVGGCVRDLLLKKTPKDFDVITTAALKKIRKQFYGAEIVGQRFPICRVHMKGSVIEVSSFETVAKHGKEREELLVSQTPKGCDKSDLVRWRDSMKRDFTINSLFFDPFVHKIYDYANGMKDILDLKLRTLLPAQLSFKEDSARILRGLRIAARLGLSLSKETETAIYELASSLSSLCKSRIILELNYMLSYGAAEPSLRLLQRFHLLDLFLPFHAAILSQQATMPGPIMLMKLFSHLDQLVACDRPSDSNLWIGLLAFHLALVNNPQHPHVVFTFASILYHRKWTAGVEFARLYSRAPVVFVPETSQTCSFKSDDELAERVKKFSLQVQNSIDVLTEKESLFKAMAGFPGFPCSGLVFVSMNKRNIVRRLFDVPVPEDLKAEGSKHFEIDYDLLGKGDVEQTKLALGKIILDTMSNGVRQGGHRGNNDDDRKSTEPPFNFKIQQDNLSEDATKKKQKEGLKRKRKEKVAVDRNYNDNEVVRNAYDGRSHDNVTKKRDEVANKAHNSMSHDNASKKQEDVATSPSPKDIISELQTFTKKEVFENEKHAKRAESSKETPVYSRKCIFPKNQATQKQQNSVRRCDPLQGNEITKEECHSDPPKEISDANLKHHQKKDRRLKLSSLFK